VENALVWGTNGGLLSVMGVAGGWEDICYTYVIGLSWGRRILPLREFRVSAPPLQKLYWPSKIHLGHVTIQKANKMAVLRAVFLSFSAQNIQQKSDGRET